MVSVKHSASTVEDLMALPEDMKAELIDGVIYAMAPAIARHSLITGILGSAVSNYCSQKRKKDSGGNGDDAWIVMPEAWVGYDEHNSFVHDIAAFREKELFPLPTKGPITATPVWVCEVLSPSNWSNDTQRKRVILEEHRVPHYWLVDPERKSIQVFEMVDNASRYQIACSVDNGDGVVKLPPFTDLELDLMEIFRR